MYTHQYFITVSNTKKIEIGILEFEFLFGLLNNSLSAREVGRQYNFPFELALCCQLKEMILIIRIGKQEGSE